MLKRTAVLLALLTASAQSPAHSADALALKVFGFSPDGRYFGFMQYAPLWEASKLTSEVIVIDASTDRLVQGAPLRAEAEMKDDATEDNIGPHLSAFLAQAERRAQTRFAGQKIGRPGTVLTRVSEARVDEHSSGSGPDSGRPTAGALQVTARHSRLGDLDLKLELKEIDWPPTSKLGSHKDAASCAKEVDWQKGAGFRLTLTQGGRTLVLNDDRTIPASRNCATGYGIAEVRAYDRPDGKTTLAVIVGMESRGFEGEDRTFLAVTRVLVR